MKAIVIILVVFVVAALGGLTDEQKARLKTYKESCISETGVDPVAVENAKRGEMAENDEKLACFANCLLQKIGFISADGDVNWEVIRAKVPSDVLQDQVDQLQNKCQGVDGSGCQKGAKLFKCFLKNKNFHLLS
ncbi:general odorant-binding protein 56d [Linepithema humile]|uniref:general odorant-binding protein 56d n=1 Tax=Linepithema humile TaxID=83485 RepID=UPI0006231D96|nr:PREDICTED: general odorant-binding protein 56d-like [Linepithema humile]